MMTETEERGAAQTRASLVILAAGMGSRYGGLKQMESVGPNGELLIEYSIFDALAVGIHRIVFVIQKMQEDSLRELLAHKLEGRCEIAFVHQEVSRLPPGADLPVERRRPWGTGHAVLSSREEVRGPFAVINADDFYGRDSFAQLAASLGGTRNHGDRYSLIGFDLEKTLTAHGTVSRGICTVDEKGFLTQIEERTRVELRDAHIVFLDETGEVQELPDDAIASMNMWAFPTSFMRELERKFSDFLADPHTDMAHDEFLLPGAVSDLVAEKRAVVRVLPTSARWMGITYRDDILHVREELQTLIDAGVYPPDLWGNAP
ncbi:NDP-sugar synthase [Candidatus Bipolaricaulota bacterium]